MPHFRDVLQVKLFGRNRGGLARLAKIAATLLALAASGCTTPTAPPPTTDGPKVAPSTDVSVDQAWHDAKLVAGREPGRTPVVGTGTSMAPVYGDDTMLVINPIAYGELRAGMIVAYRNSRGVRVVHRLVEKVAGGWRVMGLNNERIDTDLVTRSNLLGVIYASFNYDADEPAKK